MEQLTEEIPDTVPESLPRSWCALGYEVVLGIDTRNLQSGVAASESNLTKLFSLTAGIVRGNA